MKIIVTSVLVDDQDKALGFYTEALGFVKKGDIPVGEARWLTVVSPEEPDGVELLLEPDGHPAAKPFKQALVDDGIPYTSFAVEDVRAEYERLAALGVRFTQEPLEMGPVTTAVFDDTCGNLIQIASRGSPADDHHGCARPRRSLSQTRGSGSGGAGPALRRLPLGTSKREPSPPEPTPHRTQEVVGSSPAAPFHRGSCRSPSRGSPIPRRRVPRPTLVPVNPGRTRAVRGRAVRLGRCATLQRDSGDCHAEAGSPPSLPSL